MADDRTSTTTAPPGRVPERLAGGAVRRAATALAAMALAGSGIVAGLVATTPAPAPRQAWVATAELPSPRGEVAATTAHRDGRDVLVVAGGLEGLTARTSTAVDRFDPAAGSWEQLPDLPAPRHHAAAAALDDDVYVSGGAPSVGDWTPQPSLWVLRAGGEDWEELALMPEGRDSHRMRALGGRLVVVGGHGASADTLVYDPATDGWSRAAPLPAPRHHLAVVAHAGELWALGGRDHDERVLDAVHIWDPGADTWRAGPALPFPVSAAAEGVLDGRIHLVGGEDPATVGGGVIDDHLVLEPETAVWQHAAPAPVAVHGAAAGVVDGRLVVAGGARRQGALSVLAWTDFTAVHERPPR